MTDSFFYLQAPETPINHKFVSAVREFSTQTKNQAYIIDKPLGDNKYSYAYHNALVLLMPKHKITFVDFGGNPDDFDDFKEDFIEDLGSISDKYRYKDHIGRPKSWKTDLIESISLDAGEFSIDKLKERILIEDPERQRICELLLSLLTGSINDIEKVEAEVPDNVLDKIKKKILLFDGDQTRFVYLKPEKKSIRIQGLSGTGKTELLLHKLKELYLGHPNSRIAFTCHNKILADNLKKRIPEFFNFMKVEEQIKWDERLWCANAWGSQANKNSGIYSYICQFYNIPFHRYSSTMSFDRVCSLALEQIRAIPQSEKQYAFDFVLIDESQDFSESFFQLCDEVTKETVYIAGDVFQGIFDNNLVTALEADFLLSKCYRTDPRTLMFAHSLGMGLFESRKLRWLEDEEWKACGYIVEKKLEGAIYRLTRESLRRFEDLMHTNQASAQINSVPAPFYQNAAGKVIETIQAIKEQHPTVTPDDIGIIFLDRGNAVYSLADSLEILIPRNFGWQVNKAYESKTKEIGKIFVSNKNNVKGLEFPFVICLTANITNSYSYRNSLYMTLTRSFIQTFLLVQDQQFAVEMDQISSGLEVINKHGCIEVQPPSLDDQARIRTTIKYETAAVSFFDMTSSIFQELDIPPIFHNTLHNIAKTIFSEDYEYEELKELIEFNYNKMAGGRP